MGKKKLRSKGKRKFGGKTFHWTATGSKSDMRKEGQQWKEAGYNARVVPATYKGRKTNKLYVGKKSGKSIYRK